MKTTDLIILGAGPGGYETAVLAAKAGLTTVIIEADRVGGTCLNTGCIPTKCFCRNAEVLQSLHEGETFGLTNLAYDFDFAKVVERKNHVVATLQAGVAALLQTPGITLVKGRATFAADAHSLFVEGATTPAGEPTETDYTARTVIIATGSQTKYLPVAGAHAPGVLSSTELLDIDHIPPRLCVIGGGVIGMEFASIFRAFGSEVTVVEFCKEILPSLDSDIAKRLRQTLKNKGISFLTQAAVTAIETSSDGALRVVYESKGKTADTVADTVLMAVGRAANVNSLNLADAGIAFSAKGIETDDNLETNIKGVYAIGDINGKCQLAHAASFQGKRALSHILERADTLRLDQMPAAVFTSPEVATVGLSEDECKAQALPCTVHKSFFRANGKALAMNEPDGMVKVVAAPDGKLLGCHILGAHAADLIQEVAALLYKDATLTDLAHIIHAHPTLGEIVMNAAESAL